MPTVVEDQIYYRTLEACQKAGISKATFFRWLRTGVIEDVMHKDRKGWRLFAEADIERIKSEVNRTTGLNDESPSRWRRNE